jgi:hypothetical protein
MLTDCDMETADLTVVDDADADTDADTGGLRPPQEKETTAVVDPVSLYFGEGRGTRGGGGRVDEEGGPVAVLTKRAGPWGQTSQDEEVVAGVLVSLVRSCLAPRCVEMASLVCALL